MKKINWGVILVEVGECELIAHKIENTLKSYNVTTTNFFKTNLVKNSSVAIIPASLVSNFSFSQKILVIPRFSEVDQLVLNMPDTEFNFVFSTEKTKKDFLIDLVTSPIQFFSGVATKLAKKLAKKVCEEILGQSVIMVHEKKLF